jgi:hypothetical protein
MRAPASHRLPGIRTLAGALCLVLAGAVAGCAEPEGQVDVAAASAAAAMLTSPIDGQVVKLESEGLTKVRGFVLRTDDGRELAFSIGVLENGAEFPPSHLAEHMATGSAVRISFRDEGGVPVVYRIEDAPGP